MCKEQTQKHGAALAGTSVAEMKANVGTTPLKPTPVCRYLVGAKLCCYEPPKKKHNSAVMLRSDVAKKNSANKAATEVHSIVETGPVSLCVHPECAKDSCNGCPGEYCCVVRKRAVQEEDAHKAEEELWENTRVVPVCLRPGCGKGSWNGGPREYCSKTCKILVQEQDALNAAADLLQDEDAREQKSHVKPGKKNKQNALMAKGTVAKNNSRTIAATEVHNIVEKKPVSGCARLVCAKDNWYGCSDDNSCNISTRAVQAGDEEQDARNTEEESWGNTLMVQVCFRPGCTKGSWNGGPREYCSKTCKRIVQDEDARKAEEELLQEEDAREQKSHAKARKKNKQNAVTAADGSREHCSRTCKKTVRKEAVRKTEEKLLQEQDAREQKGRVNPRKKKIHDAVMVKGEVPKMNAGAVASRMACAEQHVGPAEATGAVVVVENSEVALDTCTIAVDGQRRRRRQDWAEACLDDDDADDYTFPWSAREGA